MIDERREGEVSALIVACNRGDCSLNQQELNKDDKELQDTITMGFIVATYRVAFLE
jgi:hypothetical protein